MTKLDVGGLVTDILTAADEVAGKDSSTLRGFSQKQLKGLAVQAAWIAASRAAGELDDDLYGFLLQNLKNTASNFVAVLKGLTVLVLEKVLNTVIRVLLHAIGNTVGIAVP